jgi:hypothetical protein
MLAGRAGVERLPGGGIARRETLVAGFVDRVEGFGLAGFRAVRHGGNDSANGGKPSKGQQGRQRQQERKRR